MLSKFFRTLQISQRLLLYHQTTMAPIWVRQKSSCEDYVKKVISSNRIAMFSKTTCPFCLKAKELLTQLKEDFFAVELDKLDSGRAPGGDAPSAMEELQQVLLQLTGQRTVPNIFIHGVHVGGCDVLVKADKTGKLQLLLQGIPVSHDLVVIGGGSGGLAASKEAKRLGMDVVVLDFVKPTPWGTKWGLGGTCVNVGCIPKKLMHRAALLKEDIEDAPSFGWDAKSGEHSWSMMTQSITSYIKSLNFKYRSSLVQKQVMYKNTYGRFIDDHTIECTDVKGNITTLTSNKFIIAVGGRPLYPDIPGAKEHGITSDDLFFLPYNPGKTLLIGASYIALECAGFLNGLGIDCSVMVRSILLRGFDQQMANMIGEHMQSHGVKFIENHVPVQVEELSPAPRGSSGERLGPAVLKVTSKNAAGELHEFECNTVIFAIGREACTSDLGLDKVNVEINPRNKKVIVNEKEETSNGSIYAIGDVIDGRLELTPVAIQAGRLLARRLFGDVETLTDYDNVPTTVFTPMEYGCVGLSEEAAIEKFGLENIEVYHSHFQPLEYELSGRDKNKAYGKLICLKPENEKIVGFHVLSPNAGEITQGYAIALKLQATKADLDSLVGIHPTCAEWFTVMEVTKASGQSVTDANC